MRIIRNVKKMQSISRRLRLSGKTIGFVPTMGALHDGHLSLIRRARKDNDVVVVSIFVNPAQFGVNEDFKKYPRNLKQDARFCKKEEVDIIFFPSVSQVYPKNFQTYVSVYDLSKVLCGKYRPGHFKGVATVVMKLFNIANPDTAYFGQKDAQQAIIIKRLVLDLNIPVQIKVLPIIREQDGLAISSRNIYLDQYQREDAVILYRALRKAKDLVRQGKTDTKEIIRNMKQLVNSKKSAKVQYISIVDLERLKPVDKIKDKALIALAVFIGKTRLIDNMVVNPNIKYQNPK